MKKSKLILSIMLLSTCGGSCGLFGDFSTEPNHTEPSTPSNNNSSSGGINIVVDNPPDEDKPEEHGENPETKEELEEKKKRSLMEDKRVLNSKGAGFTYLDYDLEERFKSWEDLIEENIIVLTEDNAIASVDTDSLGKGVLDIPENVIGITSDAEAKSDMINSIIVGVSSWVEEYSAIEKVGKNSKKIIIRDGTTIIWNDFFANFKELEEIDLPSTVKKIHSGAFANCTSLKKVDLSHTSITTIESYLFDGCTSLEEVIMPENNDGNIGRSSFRGCVSLHTLTIPGGVNKVSPYSFDGCSSLSQIILNNTVTTIPEAAFKDCSSCSFMGLQNLVSVEPYAFYNCKKISVMDLRQVYYIGAYAFTNTAINHRLKLDSISSNSLEQGTFEGNSSLLYVDLNSNIEELHKDVFKNNKKLISVEIADGGIIKIVGSNAFYGCNSLNEVNFLNSNEEIVINENAFTNCGEITNKGILNLKAKEIKNNAFEGSMIKEVNYSCTSSSSGFIPDSDVGGNFFLNCTSLKKFNYYGESYDQFPFESGSFTNCTNLEEVSIIYTDENLINSTSAIEQFINAKNCFKNCYKLAKITFSGTVDSWITSLYDYRKYGNSASTVQVRVEGNEPLDPRNTNIQITCLNGCKKTGDNNPVTLNTNNILNYIAECKM